VKRKVGDAQARICAHCRRKLRDDAEWLRWRTLRDANGALHVFCGDCVSADLRATVNE
jgi:hypothetical protein